MGKLHLRWYKYEVRHSIHIKHGFASAGGVQVRLPDNGQRGPIVVQRQGLTAAAAPQRTAPRAPEDEKTREKRAKLRELRITLQRVAGRLGTPDHSLVKQIKYRSSRPAPRL